MRTVSSRYDSRISPSKSDGSVGIRRAPPLDDASKLTAHMGHNCEHGIIRLRRLVREEFHYSGDLFPYQHRKGEAGSKTRVLCRLRSRKIVVFGHVDNPRRFPFLENATRWADALRGAGADVVMTERDGSHGGAFWRAELPLMVAWAFGA